MTPLLFFPWIISTFISSMIFTLPAMCFGSPHLVVVNLKTSSSQISVLVSPAQFLKVGPRRKCGVKAAHAICWVLHLTAQVRCWFPQIAFPSCDAFTCSPHTLCFHSWASCPNARGTEAVLASHNCLVFQCGHWWLLGNPHWNVNTSKHNHYPKPISLSLHIWQLQSFAF